MVLVQQRNPMAAPLVYELKRRHIDVAGSDRIILPEFPAIRDLLNLVRWCLNQADDYSLCCVLKSPIFYLKERDIYNLCKQKNTINHERKTQDKNAVPITVFEILENTSPEIFSHLYQIKEWSEKLSPYSFFTNVLNTNNVRRDFIAALGNQVIEPLEEFMTICLAYERTQPGTLKEFLKWFITGGSQIKRDMNATDGVRIATVHGSKGLEAPVVFLIDTVRTPKSEKILPIPSVPEMPVWLWTARTNTGEKCLDAQHSLNNMRIAEYYRLLYVAMTRARDELYIYGYTPHKNAVSDAWHTQLWRVLTNNSDSECIRITNDDIA
jgi:ATP-dependent helicase/nuclease subunit A